jgi:serine/threonine-protein kinase
VLNDRYKIVEAIGHGGMGRVYKALQAPLERVVALKILGAGHDRDPNFFKRFFLEASVTAKLTHPNTITLYDYGRTDDGIFFIAMEFLDGRTLSQAMQAEGPLAQDRVIHIAQQICRSLREAHALGIIHRDLKPANVMLLRQQDDHDFVKVLDFGLVKFFSGDNPETDITNAGTFMGSPHYIAPEQARNQSPDQRCDIYSLGVLLYHMLTGRVPFTAPAPVDIILKHLHDAPVPPRQLRPDLQIAPELQRIVLRCMAKGREQRYQSMDELLVHLKAVRAHLTGISAPHSVPPQTGPQPQAKPITPGMIAQTPPTPQPGLRTPSQPMSALRSTPARGTPHATKPPPPPPEAMLDDDLAPLGRVVPGRSPRPSLAALSRLPVIGRLLPRILARVGPAVGRLSSEVARVRSGIAQIASPIAAALKDRPQLRLALPPALIVMAGIGTAAYVLWAPAPPAPPLAAAVPVAPPEPAAPPATAVPVALAAAVPVDPAAAVPVAPTAAVPVAPPPPAPAPLETPAPAVAYPAAFAGTTLVTVTSTPAGAEVRDAEDHFLGTTPFDLRVPSKKPLQLTLRHDGYRPASLSKAVKGERMSLSVTLKSARTDPYESKPDKRSVGYKDDPY